jgi:hypothetical protein
MNLFALVSVLFAYSWGASPDQVKHNFTGLSSEDESTWCRSRSEQNVPLTECFHFHEQKLTQVLWTAHVDSMKSYEILSDVIGADLQSYPYREQQKNLKANQIVFKEAFWKTPTMQASLRIEPEDTGFLLTAVLESSRSRL